MRKNKGFTLIELLAVIVVLAIIALIATPIVMNTIKSSKKGAAEQSGESYIKQVETSLMEYRIKTENTVPDGTYQINSDGNLEGEGLTESLKIEMNGTKPSAGEIVIENGMVKRDESPMVIGNYSVAYNTTSKSYVAVETGTTPALEVLCTKGEGVDLSSLNYGDKFTCELGDDDEKTFYVLETNSDNVSLIMNMNIDGDGKGTTSENTVSWCKSGYDSSCNADGAIEYLKTGTTTWTKLNESQISLPSGQQIAIAGGDTAWTDTNYTETVLSSWLYENLNNNVPYGYWTSTPDASDSENAWIVTYFGDLYYWEVGSYPIGVRPVITISKTQLG